MGNFMVWLLGIPTAALVFAYVVICACLMNAKRRMADQEPRTRQPARVIAFNSHRRGRLDPVHRIDPAQAMARRAGN